jgi:hypothetical protein
VKAFITQDVAQLFPSSIKGEIHFVQVYASEPYMFNHRIFIHAEHPVGHGIYSFVIL